MRLGRSPQGLTGLALALALLAPGCEQLGIGGGDSGGERKLADRLSDYCSHLDPGTTWSRSSAEAKGFSVQSRPAGTQSDDFVVSGGGATCRVTVSRSNGQVERSHFAE